MLLLTSYPSSAAIRHRKGSDDYYEETGDRYLTIEVHEQQYDDPPVILDQYGVPFPPSYSKPALGFHLPQTRSTRRRR